ncbi:MAG: Hsp70 family protein [Isosphaeraceae bacterium]|nr:Hsp70 family protein [Isosphaeraceae bacterium]
MTRQLGTIGIDFGTSNTHLAYLKLDGDRVGEPVILRPFNEPLVRSCVLWDLHDGTVDSIGENAENAYFECETAEERARFRLSANFKPDILRSEQARRDAVAFLARIYRELERQGATHGIGKAEGMPVVIGVPSAISDEQRAVTVQLAREAGFGDADSVDEPLGALAHHLKNRDIQPHEARNGVLVIDFGGGTLDIALVNAVSKGFQQPWGDSRLGGRLIDDVFLTWLLDQNPDLREYLDEFPLDRVPWFVACRKVKEAFSRDWASKAPRPKYVVQPGMSHPTKLLRSVTVEEFERRCRDYTPSAILADYFRSVGGPTATLADLKNVDLFQWIANTIRRSDRPVDPASFSKVLLTGGSACWPFMKTLAKEALGIDDSQDHRIATSADPLSAVGVGLAIYPLLRDEYARKRTEILLARSEQFQKFSKAVDARLTAFSKRVAERCVQEIMPSISSRFLYWYDQGGSLASVASKIDGDVKEKQRRLEELIAEENETLITDTNTLRIDFIRGWLKEHGIARDPGELILEEDRARDAARSDGLKGPSGNIAGEIATLLTAAITVLVVTVVSVVKGAILVKLFLAFPPLAVLAVVIGIAAGEAMNDMIKDRIAAHNWGSWPGGSDWGAMRFAISRDKINASLRDTELKLRDQLTRQLYDNLTSGADALMDQVPAAKPSESLARIWAAPTPISSRPVLPAPPQSAGAQGAADAAKGPRSIKTLLLIQFLEIIDRVVEDLSVLEDFRSRPHPENPTP